MASTLAVIIGIIIIIIVFCYTMYDFTQFAVKRSRGEEGFARNSVTPIADRFEIRMRDQMVH